MANIPFNTFNDNSMNATVQYLALIWQNLSPCVLFIIKYLWIEEWFVLLFVELFWVKSPMKRYLQVFLISRNMPPSSLGCIYTYIIYIYMSMHNWGEEDELGCQNTEWILISSERTSRSLSLKGDSPSECPAALLTSQRGPRWNRTETSQQEIFSLSTHAWSNFRLPRNLSPNEFPLNLRCMFLFVFRSLATCCFFTSSVFIEDSYGPTFCDVVPLWKTTTVTFFTPNLPDNFCIWPPGGTVTHNMTRLFLCDSAEKPLNQWNSKTWRMITLNAV